MSTLSLLTIPREKMAEASGITNTVRQLGGSLGVAMFTTMLTSRINYHLQMYGSAIQSGTQQFKNVTTNLTYFAQQHCGSSLSTAVQQSKYMILSFVNKQAYIQGIDDDFWIAAIITMLGAIPVIVMRTKKSKPVKA